MQGRQACKYPQGVRGSRQKEWQMQSFYVRSEVVVFGEAQWLGESEKVKE